MTAVLYYGGIVVLIIAVIVALLWLTDEDENLPHDPYGSL